MDYKGQKNVSSRNQNCFFFCEKRQDWCLCFSVTVTHHFTGIIHGTETKYTIITNINLKLLQ